METIANVVGWTVIILGGLALFVFIFGWLAEYLLRRLDMTISFAAWYVDQRRKK